MRKNIVLSIILFGLLVQIAMVGTVNGQDNKQIDVSSIIPSNASIEISSSPQKTGKIYGHVKNGETGEPLHGANIFLINDTDSIEVYQGAFSDRDGKYYIVKITPDIYTLESTYIGYETIIINSVKIQERKSTNVNIVMYPTIIPLSPKIEEQKVSPSILHEKKPRVRFIQYDDPPIPGQPIFIPDDEPPKPIGGYAAIQKNIVYPDSARKGGIEGKVVVQAYVDETGKFSDAIVLKGISGLNEAAINVIKKTQFKPAKQNNIPVGVWIAIPVEFRLPKK